MQTPPLAMGVGASAAPDSQPCCCVHATSRGRRRPVAAVCAARAERGGQFRIQLNRCQGARARRLIQCSTKQAPKAVQRLPHTT